MKKLLLLGLTVALVLGAMPVLAWSPVLAWDGCNPDDGTINVGIDVKPESCPSSINLGSHGRMWVAVWTTDSFDASTIDPGTVDFAGAAPVRSKMEDVDGDGDLDLLLQFKTQELVDLDETSTTATLTGETYGGQPIEGTFLVNIVPKGKK